jgi:hypothetical protein
MTSLGSAVAALYLAAPSPTPSPSDSGGDPSAGPTALVIILLLCLAMVFLARSLMKHLGRVPESFDPPDGAPRQRRGRPGRHQVDSAAVDEPIRRDDE